MHIKHTTESEIPSNKWQTSLIPVADPDLHIRGGGHPDPEVRGGGGLKKTFFFGLKIREGGTGPPGPSPGSATGFIQALSPYKKFTSCK